ncbi:phage portal protein [Malikia sp.]|uniref:phage portal protein n=1 Tax=Malikia sp. TaxID=2070706 RepID=UPI00261FE083|nr:phage portal protein [Malikia sp.]MDD2728181.1 phage portal protein [Malikia sp.]
MFFSQIFSGSGALMPAGSGGWLGSSLVAGGTSEAGPVINPQTALALTAVQRAVTLLAESIAQLPCRVYQATSPDDRKPVIDHPAHRVISVAPNGWMTPFQVHEYKQLSAGLRGNGFALKELDMDGSVKSLYPLHPDRVQVMVSPQDRMPYYRVLLAPDGIEGVFPLRRMHHVRWIGDNVYAGLSPIALHREALGIVAASERHTARVFGNGTRLSGVLTRPREAAAIKEQGAIDKLLSDWKGKYGGAGKAGEVALLQEGMEFKPLSMSNEDAQLIEARSYGVRDIARIYGIPPHKLGDLSGATFSNIEQQSLEFVVFTLMPWLKRHEESMERDLLTEEDRAAGVYIQFDVAGLLRGDTQSRYAAYAQARQWGWLSVNDIRRLENLPPIAGGDVYLTPLNMADGKTGLAVGPVNRAQPSAQQINDIDRIFT